MICFETLWSGKRFEAGLLALVVTVVSLRVLLSDFLGSVLGLCPCLGCFGLGIPVLGCLDLWKSALGGVV